MKELISHSLFPLLAITCFAFLIQMGYLAFFFFGLKRAGKNKPPLPSSAPVSVVICAKNEAETLRENLPLILEQDHPKFEVVVVNDHSSDNTLEILKSLQSNFPHLKVISTDDQQPGLGKKKALTTGVKAAQYHSILVTDADCQPTSSKWIGHMTAPLEEGKEIVLGHSPYQKRKGFLNKMIRFDTFFSAIQYCSFAVAGIPYMGVGRNMAFSRELFLSSALYEGDPLTSGDDDLFIQQKATGKNTTVVLHPEATTISSPPDSWKARSSQKRRHLTTAPEYSRTHQLLLLGYPFSLLFFYLGFLFLIHDHILVNALLVLFMIRVSLQIITFRFRNEMLGEKDLLSFAPFLEVSTLVLNLVLYLTRGRINPDQWKEERIYPKKQSTITN